MTNDLTKYITLITRYVLVGALGWATPTIMTPMGVQSTPTLCEFIAVELFASVDRGELREEDAAAILERCQKIEHKYP